MDQLPIEILMKIFGFLNRFGEILLVSKKFYDVACKVNDPNICLSFYWDHFREVEWLPSIVNSNRQITKIEFDRISPSNVISIVQSFSQYIKYLSICSLEITMSEFLEILSLAPNAEALTIQIPELRPVDQESNEIFSCNGDLNLLKLKTLRCVDVCDEIMAVFERLPEGVLTEFMLEDSNFDASTALFKRQTNIKNLKLMSVHSQAENTAHVVFENLNLESFTTSYWVRLNNYRFDLQKALLKQTKLKSLLLISVDVHENFLGFVASQFTELESFSMEVRSYPNTNSSSLISRISNFKTMKYMSLHFSDNQITSVIGYHNPGITKVTLLDEVDYDTLRESVPNLKVLRVLSTLSSQQLNVVMRKFNFVEVLETPYVDTDDTIPEGDCYNPKLMELRMDFAVKCETPILMDKCMASYPNLRKLELVRQKINASLFKRILDGYTKLEFLKLHTLYGSGCDLTMDDLNYLKDHGKNLTRIHLGRFAMDTLLKLDELKRDLGGIFGVICYDVCNLYMAIDRSTYNKTWYTPFGEYT